MKKMVTLAAMVAITAATAANASTRPTAHSPGGPVKQGAYCWVYTSPTGAGWWDLCDGTSSVPRGKSQRDSRGDDFSGAFAGGGGSGGGGGNR